MINIIISTFVFFLLLQFIFLYPKYKRIYFNYFYNKVKLSDFDPSYEQLLEKSFPPYRVLNDEEKVRLKRKILYFLKYKKFWPLQDFVVTEEMKFLIASQACFLIMNIDAPIYPSLTNIYLSVSAYVEKKHFIHSYDMTTSVTPRLGESYKDGPVILSWSTIKQDCLNWYDGQNVILHEFAHQLDALDGGMDGTPPLKGIERMKKWSLFMGRDFKDLRENISRHRKSDIDSYAATNEAEFFAVTVEEFYERPRVFYRKHPEIFNLYMDYFNFDPRRLPSY